MGEICLYDKEDPNKLNAKVAPVGGRLVVFFSDTRVPHEVLGSKKMRFSVTSWYLDTSAANGGGGNSDTMTENTVTEKAGGQGVGNAHVDDNAADKPIIAFSESSEGKPSTPSAEAKTPSPENRKKKNMDSTNSIANSPSTDTTNTTPQKTQEQSTTTTPQKTQEHSSTSTSSRSKKKKTKSPQIQMDLPALDNCTGIGIPTVGQDSPSDDDDDSPSIIHTFSESADGGMSMEIIGLEKVPADIECNMELGILRLNLDEDTAKKSLLKGGCRDIEIPLPEKVKAAGKDVATVAWKKKKMKLVVGFE